jgi:outer membrane lipoprotein SlyB
MSEQRVIVGVFADREQAEHAIKDLRASGVSQESIGIVEREEESGNTDELPDVEKNDRPDVPTGLVAGGVVGGMVGTALSLLIPGGGSNVAGKLLATTLGGAAGMVAGGLIGTLVGHGMKEEEAQYYELELQSGRTVVIVQADEQPMEIMRILKQNHAYANGAPSTLEAEEDPEATIKLKALEKH